MSERIDAGAAFPEITLALQDGGVLTLPDDFSGSWGVVLLYRGHW